jgi:hypothetical protein
MAFRYAGDELLRRLDIAAQNEEKLRDTGPVTRTEGVAVRGGSDSQFLGGAQGEFHQVANDPKLSGVITGKAQAMLNFRDAFG